LGRRLTNDDALGAVDRSPQRVQKRRLPGRDAAGDNDVLSRPDARGQEVGRLPAQETELDEFVEGAGGKTEAPDRADRAAVGRDRRYRRCEARAVGQPRLDARSDPVEALALYLLEQALHEGTHLTVVVEDKLGNALDPLAGVAEDTLRAIDHP